MASTTRFWNKSRSRLVAAGTRHFGLLAKRRGHVDVCIDYCVEENHADVVKPNELIVSNTSAVNKCRPRPRLLSITPPAAVYLRMCLRGLPKQNCWATKHLVVESLAFHMLSLLEFDVVIHVDVRRNPASFLSSLSDLLKCQPLS